MLLVFLIIAVYFLYRQRSFLLSLKVHVRGELFKSGRLGRSLKVSTTWSILYLTLQIYSYISYKLIVTFQVFASR